MTVINATHQSTISPKFKAGALVKFNTKYWTYHAIKYTTSNVKNGKWIYLPPETVFLVVRAQQQIIFCDTWCNHMTVLFAEKLVDIFSISIRNSVEDLFIVARSKRNNGINKQKRP